MPARATRHARRPAPDWRSWPGGSPLRAAGGQPCWNARPGPDPLSAVASESKDKPPKRLGF